MQITSAGSDMPDLPSLTIVTIVRNHMQGLLKTIRSVRSQTFKNFEYIVVDGCSEDGTLQVIEDNKEIFSKILYGPDKGIYDAMNKGICAATGEYILFMNAGDIFASETSVYDVLSKVEERPDVIYADYTVDYGFLKRNVKARSLQYIWKGMPTSHQAVYVKTFEAKAYGFNCRYRLGADFDMIYRMYCDGKSFFYVPVNAAVTEAGGQSDKKRLTVYSDHLETLKAKHVTYGQHAYYYILFFDSWLRLTLKKLLPKVLVRRIIAMKAEK